MPDDVIEKLEELELPLVADALLEIASASRRPSRFEASVTSTERVLTVPAEIAVGQTANAGGSAQLQAVPETAADWDINLTTPTILVIEVSAPTPPVLTKGYPRGR